MITLAELLLQVPGQSKGDKLDIVNFFQFEAFGLASGVLSFATLILEIGYLLLPSPDMTQIFLKRYKILKTTQSKVLNPVYYSLWPDQSVISCVQVGMRLK